MSSMQLHVLSQVSGENFSPFRMTTFSRQLVPERASCSLSTDTQMKRRRKRRRSRRRRGWANTRERHGKGKFEEEKKRCSEKGKTY